MATNENKTTKILKESGSDMKYQSTFLPIFQKAETKIKTLIILALFLMVVSEFNLRLQIMQVINFVDSKIPKDLPNREAYLQGLVRRSEFWLRTLYKPQKERFEEEKRVIKEILPERKQQEFIKHYSSNPKQVNIFVEKNKTNLDMWATQKGYPNVTDYPKELKRTIKKLADQPMTTYEPGKKPISLWQKAELDTRYFNQMQHLQDLRTQGEDLCYISSHPNCSKRCEKWQGKLVSLSKHSNMANFVVGNVDNHIVYSLPDIMAQVDKYGYQNNIINGFNCFDKETEVLTNNGWKLFADLNNEDLIYTLNRETKISEWQKPTNYFKKFYQGKMIRAKSYISDILVTPDHNMLFYQQHNTTLRFEAAKLLKPSHIQYAGQEWIGKNEKFITVGNTQVDSKLFCRLLGYYLADGSMHDNYSIKIAQTNNDEMWNSLKDLPYKMWRDDNKILVRDKDLHNLFQQLGTCQTKYVFDWVKELSKECLKEFLEAFNYTDGYKAKQKPINGYLRKPHKTLFTTNNRLCADLCEIALKCGYRPKVGITKNKGRAIKFKNSTYICNYDLFVIHLNYNTSFRYKSIEEEDYNDYVYCVEVPNHTLLVKRNGFVQWCGNCRHRLIPYRHQNPPNKYDNKEVAKQRDIESKIRELERKIRVLKTNEHLYNESGDKITAKYYHERAKELIATYKKFCEDNGYAWYNYRIDI